MRFDLRDLAMSLVAFIIAVTVHEFAHARAALSAGDETAKRMGRVSLNPIDHLDTMGTIMFVVTALNGFGIAWGKPVPVNPLNFKRPRWDSLRISIWGPLSNIITACVLTLVMKFLVAPHAPAYFDLVSMCILFNLMLAFFNMIPVPPLDGSKVLASLLPLESAKRYEQTVGRHGMLFLLIMILPLVGGHSIIGLAIRPPIAIAFSALMKFALHHGGPILT